MGNVKTILCNQRERKGNDKKNSYSELCVEITNKAENKPRR